MCGILGCFQWTEPLSQAVFKTALERLSHRGPDHQSTWFHPRGHLALGHARLSILDLSPAGNQPLFTENHELAAVVNGELYDYAHLKKTLEQKGYQFKTSSDSELVLHLYAEYGDDFLSHLRGEFAFVLWDQKKELLFAARDRFGIKPLFYHLGKDSIALASEAKALFALGIPASWDPQSVYHISSIQYTPQDRSLFQNIAQIKPGHYLKIKGGQCQEVSYWDLDYPSEPLDTPFEEQVDKVHDLLYNSVQVRLKADVPYCCHLSGGLDSSSVAGMVRHITNTQVPCFSVAFPGSDYNELEVAQRSALNQGFDLEVIEVQAQDLQESFASTVYHTEGLSINGHTIAKGLLNQAIRKKGYKVALTGEGADEVFLGYPHFLADLSQTPDTVDYLKGIMLPTGESLDLSPIQKHLGFIPTWLQAKASLGARMHELLQPEFKMAFKNQSIGEKLLENIPYANQLKGRPPVHQSAYLWTKFALANYILRTVGDGAEMMYGVEGRLPFLDHQLFEYVSQLPVSSKVYQGQEKYILREAMRPYLTHEVQGRRKRPFMAPPLSFQAHQILKPLLENKQLPAFIDPQALKEKLQFLSTASQETQRIWDPVLMLISTAAHLEESLGLSL